LKLGLEYLKVKEGRRARARRRREEKAERKEKIQQAVRQ